MAFMWVQNEKITVYPFHLFSLCFKLAAIGMKGFTSFWWFYECFQARRSDDLTFSCLNSSHYSHVWPLWAKHRGVISYTRDPFWHGLCWEQDRETFTLTTQACFFFFFFTCFLRFSDRLSQWPTLKTAVVWDHCCFSMTRTLSLSVSLSGSLAVSPCTYACLHLLISVTCLQKPK